MSPVCCSRALARPRLRALVSPSLFGLFPRPQTRSFSDDSYRDRPNGAPSTLPPRPPPPSIYAPKTHAYGLATPQYRAAPPAVAPGLPGQQPPGHWPATPPAGQAASATTGNNYMNRLAAINQPYAASPHTMGSALADYKRTGSLMAAAQQQGGERYLPARGGGRAAASSPVLDQGRSSGSTDRLTPDPGKKLLNTTNIVPDPFHLHVYSHKHNTHVSFTRPDRGTIISISAGNLGFRKSARGSYDAAFQTGAYVIDAIHKNDELFSEIKTLSIVLRGFGNGREAMVKLLLGTEGRYLRDKVISVTDSTRLKYGGTRSPRPRRLG